MGGYGGSRAYKAEDYIPARIPEAYNNNDLSDDLNLPPDPDVVGTLLPSPNVPSLCYRDIATLLDRFDRSQST
ncbi:hypothetical protein N7493_009947 [Penicillium malachiteum]|uniref:Uncharacterized protein n=1 Tax=Penicillium malachiteum TaxID=1324776 RepID=A0AAD6MS79_9EURO|nr:hypothetical protein N7493_009947 [Penicillium malachiteum]